MSIDEKELALAAEHPRGAERRRLLPYRAALNDVAAYAALTSSKAKGSPRGGPFSTIRAATSSKWSARFGPATSLRAGPPRQQRRCR